MREAVLNISEFSFFDILLDGVHAAFGVNLQTKDRNDLISHRYWIETQHLNIITLVSIWWEELGTEVMWRDNSNSNRRTQGLRHRVCTTFPHPNLTYVEQKNLALACICIHIISKQSIRKKLPPNHRHDNKITVLGHLSYTLLSPPINKLLNSHHPINEVQHTHVGIENVLVLRENYWINDVPGNRCYYYAIL